jgi:hypothetical protein
MAMVEATTAPRVTVARRGWWNPRPRRIDERWLLLAVLACWLAVQAAHAGSFLFHDAWRHNFPRVYSITKLATCGDLPRWNGTVDSGWPVVIETISSSLTNPLRLAYMSATGCLDLDLVPAMWAYKAHILVMWLALAAGAYVLGRTLLRHHLAAVFLFAAVLFAGVGLDNLHSDQDAAILFWWPWVLACAVQAHRQRTSPRGAVYFNGAVLFLCLEALDHYPHFPLVIAGVGAALYAMLYPAAGWEFVRCQLRRLWPALVLLALAGLQLWIFRDAINGFIPSQRGGLTVDLSQGGESGWAQPFVVLSAFLPLGTLAGFDYLANSMQNWLAAHGGPDQTMFVFRPNSLIYYVGFLPALFCLVFVLRPGARRLRTWWVAFTVIIFAIALQETHISYAMFYLPFFNAFRGYSLFGLFVAFGVLIMSGYGVDALLSLRPAHAHALARRGLSVIGVATALCGLVLGLLSISHSLPVEVAGELFQGLAVDLLLSAAGAAAVWLGSRSSSPGRWMVGLIGLLMLSQAVFAEGVYHLLGMPLDDVLQNYQLDNDDTASALATRASDPNTLRRKPCDSFAVCYLSRRDAVSLHLDEQGTFLRNPNEPVFQEGLAPDVVQALDGITHPIFWFTSSVQGYASRQELVDALNAHQANAADYLDQVTYVPIGELARLAPSGTSLAQPGDWRLLSLARGRDEIRLTYSSSAPAYIAAAINYDPGWTATRNGARLPVFQANFNDLLVQVPAADRGELVLAYHSLADDFFFYSRYLEVVLGLGAAIALTWATRHGAQGNPARARVGHAGEARRVEPTPSARAVLRSARSAAGPSVGGPDAD